MKGTPRLEARGASGPSTCVALANDQWDVEVDPETPTNATFVQTFVAYTTEGAWTYSLQSESTYDWEAGQWSVPVNATVSKLAVFAGRPVNLSGGLGWWVDGPEAGPDGLRLRLQVQFVFPR